MEVCKVSLHNYKIMAVNFKSLKKNLERIGYYVRTFENDKDEIQVCQDFGETNIVGLRNVKCFCSVKIVNDEYVVYYNVKSIVENEVFHTVSEVTRFIKKQFPI